MTMFNICSYVWLHLISRYAVIRVFYFYKKHNVSTMEVDSKIAFVMIRCEQTTKVNKGGSYNETCRYCRRSWSRINCWLLSIVHPEIAGESEQPARSVGTFY